MLRKLIAYDARVLMLNRVLNRNLGKLYFPSIVVLVEIKNYIQKKENTTFHYLEF